MDRLNDAMVGRDFDSVASCFAEDAVAETPDQGKIKGRNAIVEYFRLLSTVFPDNGYEYVQKHESGNVAIDEGYFTGTQSGPLPTPSGETVPPTGKQVRVRACDLATVEGGLITAHHLYFDQLELLGQLGLLPDGS
jgi:ketosteroid isomerase-like protein